MLICVSCGRKISNGRICPKCGELFCENHSICERCELDLRKIKVSRDRLFNYDIEWIELNNNKIGFYGFESTFKSLEKILNTIEIPDKINIILFPDKKSSVDFVTNMEKISDVYLHTDVLPFNVKSRYSVILSQNRSIEDYILINMEFLKEYMLIFLISFLIKFLKNKRIFQDIKLTIYEKTVDNIFKNYLNKIYYPYNKYSDEKVTGKNSLYLNTISTHSEYLALKELFTKNNMYLISDFLNYKSNILFDSMDSLYLDDFVNILSLLNAYINIVTIKLYSKNFGNIVNEYNRLIMKHHERFLSSSNCNEDLKNALNYIINQDIFTFNSIEDIAKWRSLILINAVNNLEPRYNILTESLLILNTSKIYSENIKNYGYYYHPDFGSPEDFINKFEKICKNETIHINIRLYCGQSVLEVQREQILFNMDYATYILFVKLSQYMSDLLSKNIENIIKIAKERNLLPIFKKIDAVNYLLVCSQLAKMFQEDEVYNSLTKSALLLAEKFDLIPEQITITWKSYLYEHDIELIKKIYHLFPSSLMNLDDSSKAYVNTIGFISKAILEKNYEEPINMAKSWAENIFIPDMGDPERSSRSSFLYLTFVNMLFFVLKSHNNFDILNNSKKYVVGILEYAAPTEPMISFAFKTNILLDIINDNYKSASMNSHKLLTFNKSVFIKNYCDKIISWIEESKRRKDRLFTLRNYITFTRDLDPWEKLFRNYINYKMDIDLENHIVYNDMIIFVEGKLDVKIYEIFSNRIIPDINILFIDAEGYTNLAIMQKDTKISNLQKIPLYSIYDGDTKLNPKKRKVRNQLESLFGISKENIFTLKKHSIEDYILNPTAIKKSFPELSLTSKEIERYFNKNTNKKNKKRVLNKFLIKNAIGKYDEDSAIKIASNIPMDEIEQEIKNLFYKIKTIN